MNCPTCGEKMIEETTEPDLVQHYDQEIVPYFVCPGCGEEVDPDGE